MTPRRARVLGLLLAASAFGCGSSGGSPYSFDVGSDEGGPSFVASGLDGGQNGFDAYVENSKHVAVQFVTLSCSNSCAIVEAVGTGGYPPYSFKWDNGSTTATRQVCPSSSASYNVKVTDTGSAGEISRAPETANASLTADVLSCPDASSLSCVGADAAVAAVQSGHYVGTVFCPPDGGVIETPTADGGDSAGTLTLDLSINGTAVGGSLYFIWSVGGAIAWEAGLAGALACPAGDLQASWENAEWGLPSTGPDGGMTVLATGTGTGSITAAPVGGVPGSISGSFDFSPTSGGFCRGTYSAVLTP